MPRELGSCDFEPGNSVLIVIVERGYVGVI